MSAYMDEEDEVCFVFQEDEDAKHAASQLKDLHVGDVFIFMGQKFTKRSNLGWMLGICNIEDDQGNLSHIHPTTHISLFH